jgi:hypothetical protein
MQRLALFLWLLLGPSIGAVLVKPLSIQELTARARLIVQGTVLSKSSHRDPEGRIYTQVQVRVLEAWKGTPAADPLMVVHGGGAVGEERSEVPGQVEYRVGEAIVAFLVLNQRGEAVTIGLAQGKFQVWKDEASGVFLVRNPFHGSGLATATSSKSNRPDGIERLTLSALKAQVITKEK